VKVTAPGKILANELRANYRPVAHDETSPGLVGKEKTGEDCKEKRENAAGQQGKD
jgi:hypothetical protein